MSHYLMSSSFTSNTFSTKLHPNMQDSNLIDDTYDKYGPAPQLCIQMASDPDVLKRYKDNTIIALDELTLVSLHQQNVKPLDIA